jgi:hypothetical protein
MKKVCRKCGIEKLITEFKKSKAFKDGHIARCKACINEEYKAWVENNPEKKLANREKYRVNNRERIREMDKQYYREDPERYREKARRAAIKYNEKEETKALKRAARIRMRELYPEKDKARRKVRWAVESGKMIKPKCCETCKKESMLQAHHEDYSKPLDVVWLCKACHWKIHTEIHLKRLNPETP